MSDPYCWPGTDCLKNKLELRDAERLRIVEARLVGVRDVQVARETIPGECNLEHLQVFHQTLFRDVYDWAGVRVR